jgi:PhnB protein
MTTTLNPYLTFRGDARAAMEFYQSVLGGELVLNTFGEVGMPVAEGEQDQVMHSQLETPSGFTLMGSDTPSHMDYTPGSALSISLSGDDEAELRGYWKSLNDGATVVAPLEKAPWGDTFGMLADKFGVMWLVNIAGSSDS